MTTLSHFLYLLLQPSTRTGNPRPGRCISLGHMFTAHRHVSFHYTAVLLFAGGSCSAIYTLGTSLCLSFGCPMIARGVVLTDQPPNGGSIVKVADYFIRNGLLCERSAHPLLQATYRTSAALRSFSFPSLLSRERSRHGCFSETSEHGGKRGGSSARLSTNKKHRARKRNKDIWPSWHDRNDRLIWACAGWGACGEGVIY